MDRRRFLGSLLAAGVAAHELDLDKLLWVPGKKAIFIPEPERYLSGIAIARSFEADLDSSFYWRLHYGRLSMEAAAYAQRYYNLAYSAAVEALRLAPKARIDG